MPQLGQMLSMHLVQIYFDTLCHAKLYEYKLDKLRAVFKLAEGYWIGYRWLANCQGIIGQRGFYRQHHQDSLNSSGTLRISCTI